MTIPLLISVLGGLGLAIAAFYSPLVRVTLRRLVAEPSYVTALLVLGLCALGLNSAVGAMKLHFKKVAVPLAVRALNDSTEGIPPAAGPWVQVSKDEPIDPDIQHTLGTDEYVFRDYVDTRRISPAQIDAFKDKSATERKVMVAQLQEKDPAAVISLAVTYYTGMADTVAHVPDRCMIADGYDVSTYETIDRTSAPLGAYPDGSPRQVRFRFINFEDQTGRGRVSRNVAYLFHVNGHYEPDPLGVRRSLQNLFEKYGYYAKVELMTALPERGPATAEQDRTQSIDAMADFLTHMLPEIERCLPDWKKLTAAAR